MPVRIREANPRGAGTPPYGLVAEGISNGLLIRGRGFDAHRAYRVVSDYRARRS